jgi:hypothetical protein
MRMCIPLEEEGATMYSGVDHGVILRQLVSLLNLDNKSTGSSAMSQEDFPMLSFLAVMAWDILIEAADIPAALVFVGPIGLVGLLSVMPWGLRKRAVVEN